MHVNKYENISYDERKYFNKDNDKNTNIKIKDNLTFIIQLLFYNFPIPIVILSHISPNFKMTIK